MHSPTTTDYPAETLTVAVAQTNIDWEAPHLNHLRIQRYIEQAALRGAELILFPEVITTGFTMKPKPWAENHLGETVQFISGQADKHNIAVAFTLFVRAESENPSLSEKSRPDTKPTGTPSRTEEMELRALSTAGRETQYYNRFYFIAPNQEIVWQDKRHLFGMAGEGRSVTAGKERVLWHYRGWNILPIVCYDLRFPVWIRNKVIEKTPLHVEEKSNELSQKTASSPSSSQRALEYDLILVAANWPTPRTSAWQTLLRARAIENLSYVCGANRVGQDPYKMDYRGDSAIISFKGDLLCEAKPHEEELLWAILDYKKLNDFRNKFPAWQDADPFVLQL